LVVITKFLYKGWTKNSINRLKFGTVDMRPGSGRRSAILMKTLTVDSLLLSQEDKPQSHQTVREFHMRRGIHQPSV